MFGKLKIKCCLATKTPLFTLSLSDLKYSAIANMFTSVVWNQRIKDAGFNLNIMLCGQNKNVDPRDKLNERQHDAWQKHKGFFNSVVRKENHSLTIYYTDRWKTPPNFQQKKKFLNFSQILWDYTVHISFFYNIWVILWLWNRHGK